jgi:ABC-2 type transport system ATP-binding protein
VGTELIHLGVSFTEAPLFKVNLNGQNAHQLLKAINTPLTVLQTHTPTLEDAYLTIIRRDNGT